jgi:hypothetical protein
VLLGDWGYSLLSNMLFERLSFATSAMPKLCSAPSCRETWIICECQNTWQQCKNKSPWRAYHGSNVSTWPLYLDMIRVYSWRQESNDNNNGSIETL